MITVGIDSGSRNTKAIVLKNGKIVAKAMALTDFDANEAAAKVYKTVLAAARVKTDEVAALVSTGVGRNGVKFAKDNISEISSAARGVRFVNPNANTIIDLGAEGSRAIKLKPDGKIADFASNDKCAAGAGAFIESVARILQTTPEDMGPLAMKHTKKVPMNAQCVVFAESEVVSLIHQKTAKEDIAQAIHTGIASRIASLVRGVGIVDGVALIGGPGNNIGLVQSLKNELAKEIAIPKDPDYISALGAAIYATEIV
ncbi:2-hydroxyisocaproyl-CoA dehydratase activator [Sporomusa silvacetica DSM 10669]|uniref:2-hydroxyisocaproyl-CoA dehydratase activator n=1 Tax=Sporomusa silvacetica DSM 10669 TaxID=1123289 RepID=A0ABZ3IKN4_9FIRM|nr:acyl-CoA dehydratase activase [Sporomusa silvacetica]OZC13440.1 R-phenyllactate dehydratase activator [Sporomusa silvacetica DSM 10669]